MVGLCPCVYPGPISHLHPSIALVARAQSRKIAGFGNQSCRGKLNDALTAHFISNKPCSLQVTGSFSILYILAGLILCIFPLDFWIGDQLCSLTFSLSTLWTFGCAYRNDWQADTFVVCGLSRQWGVPLALSALPSALRFIQCIKRYEDSGLYTHLINVCDPWLDV